MKRLLMSISVIVLSFFAGLALVNYVFMPLWVEREDVVEIPDLEGMEVSRAREMLEEAGLKFGVMGQNFSDDMPPGFVISQAPEEGLTVKQGRVVEVLVSLGQETVMVPDVVGFKVPQARILLERAGLIPSQEKSEISEIIKKDSVIRTEPPVKARVPRETEVKLFVSLGRTTMDMPLLEGRSLSETRQIIEALELQIVRIDTVFSSDVRNGVVLGQKPTAGSRVVKGQEVEVSISVRR
jgi:serine/threonine-protein kinase